MQLGIALVLLGQFLPSLFFDEDGQEHGSKGLWSAAQRHWSGVIGLVLVVLGTGLILANVVMAPDTLRPSDWALAVFFLIMPALALTGINGPNARLPLGVLVAIVAIAAVLFGGSVLYGSRLQWAYAQLHFLMIGIVAILAAIGFGVLRLMDWMIARSERREG